MTDSNRFKNLRTHASITNILIVALIGIMLFSGPVAAQAGAPVGGGGGDTAAYEDILTNLYNAVYLTLRYAGLATLVIGLIVWFTARRNSQRAETGMWLTMGGGAMTVLYFGLGAIVQLLEWIAG